MLIKKIALFLLFFAALNLASFGSKVFAAVSYEQEPLVSSTIKKWQTKIPANEFPSHQPSIEAGKMTYKQHCGKCHGDVPTKVFTKDLLRSKSPEEQYIIIKNGTVKGMPAFKQKLSRDEIWDALMYVRAEILGFYPLNSEELSKMNSIFGGNCAVCHGTRGHGDGPLHKSLDPVPANFNMFQRLYTRSDNRLHKEITHGIPWTAMPAWKDRKDFNQNFRFDEEMVWKLVTYVRQFGFSQELDRLDQGRKNLENYKKSIGESK